MSEPREALRRVVITGGGQVGILAAIGLRRALPRCEVIVIGLSLSVAAFADHAASALPFTNKLHDRLGIDEAQIILNAGGSHRLATRYVGWGEQGGYGLVPFGAATDPLRASIFAQEWGSGPRNLSEQQPPGSLAEVLVEAGRFAPPPPDRETPISQIDYSLRWNPAAYRDSLIRAAQQHGVSHITGSIEGVEPNTDGGIAAVNIAGQGRIDADLFVDCSGPDAVLLSSLPDYKTQSWSEHLPISSLLVAPTGEGMVALEDRVSLLDQGWLIEFAGRDGLQTFLGVAGGVDQVAAKRALQAEPVATIAIDPKRLHSSWLGNVVALGDATAQFEPLGNLHLDLAHRQLSLLLEMLPGRTIHPLERAEFNRRSGSMLDGVRDVLSMHYAAPRARSIFGDVQPTDSVELMMDQFTRRGRIPFQEELPLLKDEQIELLRALGIARGEAPQHQMVDAHQVTMARAAFEQEAKAALDFAPPYAQWLASVLRSNAEQSGAFPGSG